MSRTVDTARRALDVAVSGASLAALAPLLAVLAVLVRATSPGPAFFVQKRVGKDGRLFDLVKLRTMVADAPARGGALTSPGDPRVTRVGAWLRRWKLDELPQLVNVLRGDMSLVGPRPEVPRYVRGYSARERAVLGVRPGITDPASLEYADEAAVLARFDDCERAYVETVLPAKLALSLAYLERRTLRSDLGVLLRSVLRLARGGRAHPDTRHTAQDAGRRTRRAALG
jgi:lipopolysaccharide/colanic/teichoic acid biosynthesis glycosyltransferase